MSLVWKSPVGSLESPLKVKFSHSAIYDVFECPECFALVQRDSVYQHEAWHKL